MTQQFRTEPGMIGYLLVLVIFVAFALPAII
jgi:hypothetical protein